MSKVKFKNIAKLPKDNYQLKFKSGKKDIQKGAATLEKAIAARNEVYINANYRPANLFVKAFDMSVVAKRDHLEKSGNVTSGFQVHSRQLADRKYRPKGFSSKVAANQFAKKWIKSYNAVASVYNGWREKAFLEQIKIELETLEPCIVVGFDVLLWNRAAKEVFGDNIPKYFEGE